MGSSRVTLGNAQWAVQRDVDEIAASSVVRACLRASRSVMIEGTPPHLWFVDAEAGAGSMLVACRLAGL
jgi:hypothetical protein